MVSSETVRSVFGIIGIIIGCFLYISPLPTFVEIWKKKSVEQYSAAPYLATLLTCLVWGLYALPMVQPKSLLVLTTSAIGLTLELSYVLVFIVFLDKKKRLRLISTLVVEFAFVVVLAVLIFTLVHTTKTRSLVVGLIGAFFNVMMYAAPLSIMKLVITTKSVEYMPFLLSFVSFVSALCWGLYALIIFDPFILTPNVLGAILALIQLILYGVFYKSTKRQIEARKLGLAVVDNNEDSKKPGSGAV